jgi:hypothetical protein
MAVMRGGRPFAEILVSQLGTPKEPVTVGSVLVGLALVLAVVGYFALEYGLGMLLARVVRRLTRQD